MWRAFRCLRWCVAIAVLTSCFTGCSTAKPEAPQPSAAAAHPERTLTAWSERLSFAAGERAGVANAVDLYLTRLGLMARDLGAHDPISLAALQTGAAQLTDHAREDLISVLSAPELARFDQARDAFRAQALEDLVNTLVYQASHSGPRNDVEPRDDMDDEPQRGGHGSGRGGGHGRGGGN